MPIKALALPGLAASVVAGLGLLLGQPAGPASHTRSSGSATSTARRVTVAITNYAFASQTKTVTVGARVTWTNHDATAHTATADRGDFDTGTINPGKSKTIDFTRPGRYTYHCAFHAFMTATITVVT